MTIESNKEEDSKTIWLVSKLWIDPYENRYEKVIGYRSIGFVTSNEAKRIIDDGPIHHGTGWPVSVGEECPIFKIKKINKLDSIDLNVTTL